MKELRRRTLSYSETIVVADHSSAPHDDKNIAPATVLANVSATLRTDNELTTSMSDHQQPANDAKNYATDMGDDSHLPQPTHDPDHDPDDLPSDMLVPSHECLK